jgi:hypothetical protein
VWQAAHLERAPSGASMLLSALRARMPQASSSPDSGWNSSRLFRIVSRISSSRRDFRIFSLHGATDATGCQQQACNWMSVCADITSITVDAVCLEAEAQCALGQGSPGGGVSDVELVPVGALLVLPDLGTPDIQV